MKMLDTHVPESNSRFHGIGRCVFGGGPGSRSWDGGLHKAKVGRCFPEAEQWSREGGRAGRSAHRSRCRAKPVFGGMVITPKSGPLGGSGAEQV